MSAIKINDLININGSVWKVTELPNDFWAEYKIKCVGCTKTNRVSYEFILGCLSGIGLILTSHLPIGTTVFTLNNNTVRKGKVQGVRIDDEGLYYILDIRSAAWIKSTDVFT